MASYNIVVKPSVEKDVRRLPKKIVSNVWARIEKLKDAHQAMKNPPRFQ
jgi:mRNA-degrading endonuclease RelE of RelBE toxin-antitoxin system